MDPVDPAGLVARRRDRAIAAVLGVIEREAYAHLPSSAQHKVRKVVLDQFNDFGVLVSDILESLNAGADDGAVVILNDHWLTKLDAIYDAVVVETGRPPVVLAPDPDLLYKGV